MSLFKVVSWWSAQCSELSKKYDSASLHCCRLGLEDNEKDYVVVGSHSGHLSIFRPSSEMLEDGTLAGFTPNSLVLEVKLSQPVIGIISGKFTTNPSSTNLAILHPMKLTVYTVATTDGVAEHGDSSKLLLAYEYTLKKFAFSVQKGAFGGVKNREFLSVLHMDGSIKFFEQDGISFECKLPDERTIPFPMVYIPRIDSFVTISPGWDVECFRYQDLNQSNETYVKLSAIWSFCIGEDVLDLAVHQMSNTESLISILGEHNLFCLTDTGKTKFIKRLDYSPMCFTSFVIGWYWEPDPRLIISIVSDSGSLLIYEFTTMIWAAQLNDVPVAIQRANFKELPGSIVTLGEEGSVNVGFLGSQPSLFKVPPLHLQEMNFDKAQKELDELEVEIKAGIDFTDISLSNSSAERDLNIQVIVGTELEICNSSLGYTLESDEPKMIKVTVSLKSKINLEQVQVHLSVCPPLKCLKNLFVFKEFQSETPEKFETWIYMSDKVDVPNLEVHIFTSFINKQSIPRILEKIVYLPPALILKPCPPQKDGLVKITFSVENGISELCKIFPEFSYDSGTQAIGLKSIYSDSITTIVAAKNSNRFRVQSDEISSISLILSIFFNRFKKQRAASSIERNENKSEVLNPKITASTNLPVDEILNRVEKHFNIREELKNILVDLESKCGQMRLVERRLIVKIQDRQPGALGGISVLLKNTYSALMKTTQRLKENRKNLNKSQMELSCTLALIKNVVENFNVNPKTVEGFQSALVYPVNDWIDQSWEEITAPALDMLNHNGPLRKNQNASIEEQPNFAVTTLDFVRFKRHLNSLMDRVCRLVTNNSNNTTAPIDDSDDFSDENKLEFAEISEWVNDAVATTGIIKIIGGADE